MTEKLAQRSYYGKALAKLAETDPNVVAMDADLAGSTKTSEFRKVAPERFVEVGIAEQNLIGVAAGLAASGKTVFASTFAVLIFFFFHDIYLALAACIGVGLLAISEFLLKDKRKYLEGAAESAEGSYLFALVNKPRRQELPVCTA